MVNNELSQKEIEKLKNDIILAEINKKAIEVREKASLEDTIESLREVGISEEAIQTGIKNYERKNYASNSLNSFSGLCQEYNKAFREIYHEAMKIDNFYLTFNCGISDKIINTSVKKYDKFIKLKFSIGRPIDNYSITLEKQGFLKKYKKLIILQLFKETFMQTHWEKSFNNMEDFLQYSPYNNELILTQTMKESGIENILNHPSLLSPSEMVDAFYKAVEFEHAPLNNPFHK